MEAYGITDIGKIRRQNQDAFWLSCPEEGPAAVTVCDGMGGAKAGNVASELTATVFNAEITRHLSEDRGEKTFAEMLAATLHAANTAVYELSRSAESLNGMGTTVVAVIAEGDEATLINVGDSRAYIISGGRIRQISRDHSLVQEMVEHGELTAEEARVHPNKKYITRAVGSFDTVEGDIFTVSVKPGDVILLVTDGLTNVLEDNEILNTVTECYSARETAEALIGLALLRGAPDNVTVAALLI